MRQITIGTAAGLSLLAGLALPAIGDEQRVTFQVDGQTVVGTLQTPQTQDRSPVVLLLHGFTGTRDELPIKDTEDGVFARMADHLQDAGYASLRIDFRGSGDSEGAWADTTFSGQIADAVAAIDWLKAHEAVDGERLGVLGWSQGGLVAAHAAAARRDVDALVLWAPVVSPMHSFEPLLGAETFATALASSAETEITATLPWGAETTLKAGFFHEMSTTSTIAAAAQYDGPMLVIVGTKDTVIVPQPASGQVLLDYHDGEEKLAVFETDHVWDAFSGPQTVDTKMAPTTMEWLNQHVR